jgi:hypothetical protein
VYHKKHTQLFQNYNPSIHTLFWGLNSHNLRKKYNLLLIFLPAIHQMSCNSQFGKLYNIYDRFHCYSIPHLFLLLLLELPINMLSLFYLLYIFIIKHYYYHYYYYYDYNYCYLYYYYFVKILNLLFNFLISLLLL